MNTTATEENPFPPMPAPPNTPVTGLPSGMQDDYARWQERERQAAARRAVVVAPVAEPSPFADLFTKPTPAEIAEHEAWLKQKKAENDRDARAIAQKEWESAVPELLRDTNWRDPRLTSYQTEISRVRTWKRNAKGIYAVGKSGRGKSRSIYALARRLAVDELVPVRYLLQTEITREINRDGLNGFLEKMDHIRRCPIVVWDDFGKFAAIGSRKELLFSEVEALIDFRFSHGLPFLISSNAKDGDLMDIFGGLRGEPIMRRIGEGCEVVDFGWE
jgi:DNA replication protein DnaC